ncbi:MAG: hypothetical protein FWB86_05265 [Treponema sp.]|nr:hypothetical protein [Treponema sp.]
MNIDELNKWLETVDGSAWLEKQKAGLIKKNEQLLNELKNTASGSSLAELQKQLDQEKAALHQSLIDQPLERTLLTKGIIPICIPELKRKLVQSYGLSIKADGENRTATGKIDVDGVSTEKPLSDILEIWTESTEAKEYIKPPLHMVSTTPDLTGGDRVKPTIRGKNGRELLEMSDNDFSIAIQEEMRG